MKFIYPYRKAFTMLELIFVIIILGIVSSIGSSIIVQVYESYIMQRSIHNASIKTEQAINILSNRLTYRIDMSMLARKPGQTGLGTDDVLPIPEVPEDKRSDYSALEWIGYDSDGFTAQATPAWSGFCDLTASSFAHLVTPGSTLTTEPAVYGSSKAIVFMGSSDYRDNVGSYGAICMYQTDGCIFPVTSNGDTNLDFTLGKGDRNNTHMIYTEFYQLATSAFAVVPFNKHSLYAGGPDVWDLDLYYNYQPWDGDNYTDGSNSSLLKNISVFRFKKEVNSIRLKICTLERIGDADQLSICKEKTVIR